MTMKRIIAFVLFALMIYAGGFFIVYGSDELEKANSYPLPLDKVGTDTLQNGQMVAGTVYQQVERIETDADTVRQEIFGIEFGKPIERRFYLVPLKYEKNAEDTKYYVICLSSPESIERMEKLGVALPEPESGSGLELKGAVREMTVGMRSEVYDILSTNFRLVGVDGLLRNPTRTYYENHILPWTVYERTSFDNALAALIIGIALVLGGAVPAVILGIKIYRERH